MKAMYWGDSLGTGVPESMTAELGLPVLDGHVGGDSAAQVLARFKNGRGAGGRNIGPGTGQLCVIRCGHPEVMAGQLESAKQSIAEMARLSGDALVCELGQRSSVALGTTAQDRKRNTDRKAMNDWLASMFMDRYVPLQTELISRARVELAGQLTERDLQGMEQGMLPDILATDTAQDGHMEPLAQKWAGEILAKYALRREWPEKAGGSVPVGPPPDPIPGEVPPPPPPPGLLARLLEWLRSRGRRI